jgi:hypothetical protein
MREVNEGQRAFVDAVDVILPFTEQRVLHLPGAARGQVTLGQRHSHWPGEKGKAKTTNHLGCQ